MTVLKFIWRFFFNKYLKLEENDQGDVSKGFTLELQAEGKYSHLSRKTEPHNEIWLIFRNLKFSYFNSTKPNQKNSGSVWEY